MSGDYSGTVYYMYPAYSINLSSTPQGSIISVAVQSYDNPNRFTIKDSNGKIMAASSWMGYATYSGPWGASLSTNESQTLTFTKDVTSDFTLVVETSNKTTSDSWNSSISCSAPTSVVINPSNVGLFHNNCVNSVDSSFNISGMYPSTLLNGDNSSKTFERNFITKARINLPSAIWDSAYAHRNTAFGINYSNNKIYESRIDAVHICDSITSLPNFSAVVTNTEKSILHDLCSYLDQYQKGQISYTTMKSNISNLRSTWNAQGFNVSLHQGDFSMYSLNIADSSTSYWYRYQQSGGSSVNSTNGTIHPMFVVPLWVAMDVLGAITAGGAAAWDSYRHDGKVDWGSTGVWALSGAIAGSVPCTRWFKAFIAP